MFGNSIRRHVPLAIFLLLILAWFSPWWIGGKVMAPLDLQNLMMSPWRGANESQFAKNHIVSDGVDQYLVYRLIAQRDYREEGHVGWSSLTYGGTAQYANTMALYYDWTMQLHRWFDFWTAWHLGLIGQILLAAYGMFLFLSGRKIETAWAICGAIAYAANSQFVTWIYHRWALSAFCWVPLILWSIDLYRRTPRRGWAMVPLFIAMAFLGGTLQHAALVVIAVLAMWIEETIKTHANNKAEVIAHDIRYASGVMSFAEFRPATHQIRIFLRYLVWGVIGTGLASMMLLPCTDAFITSNRLGLHTGMVANAENSIYPKGYLQPFFNFAAYPFQVYPSILGRSGSVDLMKLFRSELFYIAYFGSLPVLIAYLAFFRRDSPLLARILMGMGLLLPLTPLVRLLYQRLFLLFIIGGILGFVHFIQHATRETRLRLVSWFVTALTVGVVVWTAMSFVLLTQPEIRIRLRDKVTSDGQGSSFGFFHEWMAQRADNFVGDLMIWSPQQAVPLVLVVFGIIGLRLSAALTKNLRNMAKIVIFLVVFSEVTLFASRWITWSDPAKHPLFSETPESLILREKVGSGGRVTTLIHPSAHMARTPFIPNTLSAYEISTITGYDSIVPNGMILPNETPGDSDRLGRLGVTHLVTWHDNPDVPQEWKPIWQSLSMDLYQNSKHMPRYAGFRTDKHKKDFFSGIGKEQIGLTEHLGSENKRILEVPLGVTWIRIAENHSAGWEYRPNEQNVSWKAITRASDGSMLIENPHPNQASRIVMRYSPPLRKLGLSISALSLLLLGTGQLLIIRNKYESISVI